MVIMVNWKNVFYKSSHSILKRPKQKISKEHQNLTNQIFKEKTKSVLKQNKREKIVRQHMHLLSGVKKTSYQWRKLSKNINWY